MNIITLSQMSAETLRHGNIIIPDHTYRRLIDGYRDMFQAGFLSAEVAGREIASVIASLRDDIGSSRRIRVLVDHDDHLRSAIVDGLLAHAIDVIVADAV